MPPDGEFMDAMRISRYRDSLNEVFDDPSSSTNSPLIIQGLHSVKRDPENETQEKKNSDFNRREKAG